MVEPSGQEALGADIVRAMADAPTGAVRDMSGEGLFRVGDRVRARTVHKAGHTRLPRYVRGRLGKIVADNGNHHLPDARDEQVRPLAV